MARGDWFALVPPKSAGSRLPGMLSGVLNLGPHFFQCPLIWEFVKPVCRGAKTLRTPFDSKVNSQIRSPHFKALPYIDLAGPASLK
jgi:hypothetical protein